MMRLLRINSDGSLAMVGPFSRQDVPRYAILSHTWGADHDEVTFKDFHSGIAKSKSGYGKIAFCQKQAAAHGLEHFWIDTCCIDKTSSAELSEAINSMYRWYRESDRCYVFLKDVSSANGDDATKMIQSSRWMTRGWTLQELLAPLSVEFFSGEGNYLGNKGTLTNVISEATTIPLAGLVSLSPSAFSRHELMRWVQRRKTKVEEDMVYCMLGLFEVSLPLVYGEGYQQALLRLEDALNRRTGLLAQISNGGFFQSRSISEATDSHNNNSRRVMFSEDWESEIRQTRLTNPEKALLRSLSFSGMNARHFQIDAPSPETSRWLFEHTQYHLWDNAPLDTAGARMLYLKGGPGVGKSVLLKESFDILSTAKRGSNSMIAAHFFDSKGHALQRSQLGLFRSVLHQFLTQDRQYLRRLCNDTETSGAMDAAATTASSVVWTVAQLKNMLKVMLRDPPRRQAIIIIDALDECEDENVRTQARFWDMFAWQTNVQVMVSCRHYPVVSTGASPVIVVEHCNLRDIECYVRGRFEQCGQDPGVDLRPLKSEVMTRSRGVFLWVVLVLDELIEAFDEGYGLTHLLGKLERVPDDLALYFDHLLEGGNPSSQSDFFAIMTWAVLSFKPLRVDEWYHVMAIVHKPQISGLASWRDSDAGILSDNQLQKRIQASSKGLVEISVSFNDSHAENSSATAFAGSLNSETGGSRFVQVIHSSICEHLRCNAKPVQFRDFEIQGHLHILEDCLRYVSLADFDNLVEARHAALKQTLSGRPSVYVPTDVLRHDNKSVSSHDSDESSLGVRAFINGQLEMLLGSAPTIVSTHDSRIPQTQISQDRSSKERRREAFIGYTHMASKHDNSEERAHPQMEIESDRQAMSSPDIPTWLANLEVPTIVPNESTRIDEPPLPFTTPVGVESLKTSSETFVLEEHMALLSYILAYFWEHARSIQSKGHVPSGLIDAFCEPRTWRRWQALDEQVPCENPVRELVTLQCAYFLEKGLGSWVKYVEECRTLPLSARPEPYNREHSQQQSSPFISTSSRPLKRRRSVASFSSASSHSTLLLAL